MHGRVYAEYEGALRQLMYKGIKSDILAIKLFWKLIQGQIFRNMTVNIGKYGADYSAYPR